MAVPCGVLLFGVCFTDVGKNSQHLRDVRSVLSDVESIEFIRVGLSSAEERGELMGGGARAGDETMAR